MQKAALASLEPSFIETLIPGWGTAYSASNNFSKGNITAGVFDLALGLPVYSVGKGLAKGGSALVKNLGRLGTKAAKKLKRPARALLSARGPLKASARNRGFALIRLGSATKKTEKAPVVIGENMKRVNRFALKNRAITIDDWLGGREWAQKLNDEFIAAMKTQNRKIVDIGPDFQRRLANRINPNLGRPASPIYGSERRLLKNYKAYQRLYERFGKFEGGVRGFDF